MSGDERVPCRCVLCGEFLNGRAYVLLQGQAGLVSVHRDCAYAAVVLLRRIVRPGRPTGRLEWVEHKATA